MKGPVIDLHVESFVRDGHRILDDIRLVVNPGEHWGIVGPNGCGKSTLLSILAAYEWPTVGRVEVLGNRYGATDMNAVKRRLGLVGAALKAAIPRQEPVRSVVASGLYALLGPWRVYDGTDYAAAEEALSRVSASGLGSLPYGILSSGQKQRVAIARALVRRPEVLVFDEPCEGLDPLARARFLTDVDRLASSDGAPTLLYVTHHLEELPRCITHALLMAEGRVVSAGPVETTLTDANLSRTFGAPCRVRPTASGGRSLEVTP